MRFAANWENGEWHDAMIINTTIENILTALWTEHIIHPDSPEGKHIKFILKRFVRGDPK